MTKTQKFFRGHRVKIADEMPRYMSHFECGIEAIIDHSYDDIYSGTSDSVKYAVLLLMPDGSKRSVAWYDQDLLTLVSDGRDAGEAILQSYKKR